MPMNRIPVWSLLPLLAASTLAAGQEQPEDLPEVDLPALVAMCEECHGERGVSDREDIPSLAGIEKPKLLGMLDAFYFYERHCPKVEPPHAEGVPPSDMCNVASELSDEEAEALAEYFAGQPPCVKPSSGE